MCFKPDLSANVTPMFEWSHGANNDLHLVYKDLRVWDFALLCLVTFNLSHGPDRDEGVRYEQFKDMVNVVVDNFTPSTASLFRARVPNMVAELEDHIDIDVGQTEEDCVWEFVRATQRSNPMGDRIKMCQYFGWWHGAMTLLPLWTLNLWKAEMVALEMDWLHGKDFMELPVVKSHVKEADALLTSTSSRITPVEAKLVRTSCKNNVVTQVALLSSYDLRRQLAHMVLFTEPVKRWQGLCVQGCKNSTSSRDWLVKQMSTMFMCEQNEMVSSLQNKGVLDKCGYLSYENHKGDELTSYVIPKDDEFAQLAAHLVLGMASKRQRRLGWQTLAWPGRHLRCLVGLAEATLTVKELKVAYEVYKFWQSFTPRHPSVTLMLGRSVFKMTATMQLVHGHESDSWSYTDAVAKLLEDRACGVGSSNVCEHVNNAMKNAKQAKGSMKFRRPQRSMAAAIAAHVLDHRYKFVQPPQDAVISKTSVALDGKAFGKNTEPSTISIKGVASTQAKAPWFSPKVENFAINGGDIFVLEQAYKKKEPAIVDDAFLSCVCNYKYNLVIKKGQNRDGESKWLYVLWHYPGSAGFGWPVTIEKVPNHGDARFLRFAENLSEPVPIVMSTWENVTALSVVWRGVSFQKRSCPRSMLSPGVRAFVSGEEMPLRSVAANNGFWDLGITILQKVSHKLGIDISHESSIVDGLFTVCKEITKMDDDLVLERCIAPRLEACPVQDTEVMDCLMEVDEAVSCLMPDEQQKFNEEKKHAKETKNHLLVVHEEYRQLKVAKYGAPAAKKAKKAKLVIPENMEAMADQKDVKKFFPQDTKVWKSRSSSAWNIQVKGWPGEKSRSVKKWGHTKALKLLISESWYQWSVLTGKQYTDAPIENLVDLGTLLES